jgi:predicted PurR-regulated permease PerM
MAAATQSSSTTTEQRPSHSGGNHQQGNRNQQQSSRNQQQGTGSAHYDELHTEQGDISIADTVVEKMAGAALLFKELSAVGIVILPVLISLLVAALLSPVVDALERRRWRRGLATTAVFVVAIIVVAGLVGLAGQQIVTGLADLSDQAVAGYKSVIKSLKSGPFGASTAQLSHWTDEAVSKAEHAAQNHSQQVLGGVVNVTSTLGHIDYRK